MSDEGGNRWGSWWNGRTGRLPNKIIVGMAAATGALGVTYVYVAPKPSNVIPFTPRGGSNGDGGMGGGDSGMGGGDGPNFFDDSMKFAAEHWQVLALSGLVLATVLALRSRGGQTAHA